MANVPDRNLDFTVPRGKLRPSSPSVEHLLTALADAEARARSAEQRAERAERAIEEAIQLTRVC